MTARWTASSRALCDVPRARRAGTTCTAAIIGSYMPAAQRDAFNSVEFSKQFTIQTDRDLDKTDRDSARFLSRRSRSVSRFGYPGIEVRTCRSLRPLAVALIIFRLYLRRSAFRHRPVQKTAQHHLSADSKEVINLVMGSSRPWSPWYSACWSHRRKVPTDTQSSELEQVSATIVELDQLLAHYGPEASEARQRLRARFWRRLKKCGSRKAQSQKPGASISRSPPSSKASGASRPRPRHNASQQKRALDLSAAIRQTRALMIEQTGGSLPWPFLTVLVIWVSLLFAGFGLFAEHNATVMAALLIGGALDLERDLPHPGIEPPRSRSDGDFRRAAAQRVGPDWSVSVRRARARTRRSEKTKSSWSGGWRRPGPGQRRAQRILLRMVEGGPQNGAADAFQILQHLVRRQLADQQKQRRIAGLQGLSALPS